MVIRNVRLLAGFLLCTCVAACGDDTGTGGTATGGNSVGGSGEGGSGATGAAGGSGGAAACIPVDDNNDCTTDVCENDAPVNNPVAEGTPCSVGVCDADGNCVAPTCTDGTQNGDETDIDCGGACAPGSTCDDGKGCAVAEDCTSGVCEGATCSAPSCGDGVTQAGEVCDDGNNTNGDGCDDGPNGTCRPTGCGNGAVSGTETCDDGNAVDGDGCDNNCTPSGCGNGVTTGTEACDDGNIDAGDGCSDICEIELGFSCTMAVPAVCSSTCGDGVMASDEGCDDAAPAEDGDGCSAMCTVESGYTCVGDTPSVCTLDCGNGVLDGTETCDQGSGNVTAGDGCSATCQTESGWVCNGAPSTCSTVCGDTIVAGNETCDDGNTTAFDGCSASCRPELTEIEPNEDGTPSTGGSGFAGNDFDTAGGIAVSNANNNGAYDVATGTITIRAALTPVGDEDVFAIHNGGAQALSVSFDVWSAALGPNVPCGTTIDTGMQIRNAAGTVLASNDDRAGANDRCSSLTFVIAANATVYAQVVAFGDATVIPGYGLILTSVPVVCGNGIQTPGYEECDDGNVTPLDGCSATCTIEGTNEAEPNEDGAVATGGTGIVGNDFDIGGSLAINNSTAQGVTNVAFGGRTWLAALSPAGDEDVFALTNTGATPVEVTIDTWDPAVGINRPCTAIDTGINLRDPAGVVVTSNDQRVGGDNCSRINFIMQPGTNRYAHVTEFGDNAVVTKYVAAITTKPVVCGDGVLVPVVEECDDGNMVDADACTNACLLGGTQNETEPNNITANADLNTNYSGDALIRGSISSTTDVDFYRIDVPAFTVLRLETFVNLPNQCDTSTTTVRIMNSAGVEITNDNAGATNASGIAACGALIFPAPAGTYYVKVEETGVNATVAKYFLQIDFLSDAGTESEMAGTTGANDAFGTASANLTNVTSSWVSGDHTLNADGDYYAITIPPGQALRAEIVEGDRAVETCEGNNVDSRLTLFDSNGTTQLLDDDDDGRGFCSAIDGTGNTPRDNAARNTGATPKVVYLLVRQSSFATTGTDGQFTYKLAVTVR